MVKEALTVRVLKLYHEDRSISKIASTCDIEPETVEFMLNDMGIKLNVPTHGTGIHQAYGYNRIYVSGKWVLEHRHIWEQLHGPLPKNWVVHHINGIRNDNRPTNLIGLPRAEHSPEATGLIRVRLEKISELETEIEQLKNLVSAYEDYICNK